MAISINRKHSDGKDFLNIEMSNGHLETLEKIKKDYGLPSEEQAIAFILGVIAQANGSAIEVNGSKYIPSDALKSGKA